MNGPMQRDWGVRSYVSTKKPCGGNFRPTLNVHSVRAERFGKDATHDHE
jgi:hypothetical protein